LAQAKALLAAARPGTRVVVIGGGLLGLEAAAALNANGVTVTVLEGFAWLLPRQLAEPAGRRVQSYVEGLGIAVRCAASVAEIYGDESVQGVRLADDTELGTDLVLLATGVRPNKHLGAQCGLETNRGVIVDDEMRTSDPDIFAAGDAAEHRGVVYGLWPIALGQGAVAGANAAGKKSTFLGQQPSNQLKVLDLPVFSIGQITPADASYDVCEHSDPKAYRRIVCHDGAIVGVNLLGDLSLAAPLKRAIEARLQLSLLPPELRRLPEVQTRTKIRES
jgi:nitrite reductase (NADH) large subunit